MVSNNNKFSPTQSVIASDAQIVSLDTGFSWLSSEHQKFSTPSDIDLSKASQVATMPCTVAMLVSDETELASLNSYDHWFFTEFLIHQIKAKRILLQLDGLLTFTEIFINNQLVGDSENAYHSQIIDITAQLKQANQLAICFRAIAPTLAKKHPRPRFATRLINERNLRFIRTPILGYTPGFAPSTKAVGPYRPIHLIYQQKISIFSSFVNALLLDENTGLLEIDLSLELIDNQICKVQLVVLDDRHQEVAKVDVNISNESEHLYRLTNKVTIEDINAYWPHTHGKPERYSMILEVTDKDSTIRTISLGKYGFRSIERINAEDFSFKINAVPMYLRGACWTPMNAKSLLVDPIQLRDRLTWLKDAGLNMLRIPGNMLYESDAFYELCDELGILIFQDFAFANFDYPETDEAFIASIQQEARHFLSKHGGRPCLTILAGNSEVYQQASMMGLELDHINNAIFDIHLPAIVKELAPNVPYVSSTPIASGLPFHSGNGPSHYYGVGGYRRSFEDARLFKGRFAAECLAFSHVPEDESLRTFFGGEIIPTHDPRWKDAVPRDVGSGWDFTDITEHYVESLFEIDATKLRAIDLDRYLNFCRAATAEVVERTLSIFRADSANGRGALVWFLHDLKAGAGWGYIDALGRPKSPFYGLARTSQPTTILFVDEGLEGLAIYLAHDDSQALDCEFSIILATSDGQIYEQKQQKLTLEPRSVKRVGVDLFLNRFVDSSYAYRFGPRAFTSCLAILKNGNDDIIVQNTYANPAVTHHLNHDLGLTATISKVDDGQYLLTLSCKLPAYYVVIDVAAFVPSDNYFHLTPGFNKTILLNTKNTQLIPHGRIRALNTKNSIPIKLTDAEKN